MSFLALAADKVIYRQITSLLLIAVDIRCATQAVVLPDLRLHTAALKGAGSSTKANCLSNKN